MDRKHLAQAQQTTAVIVGARELLCPRPLLSWALRAEAGGGGGGWWGQGVEP